MAPHPRKLKNGKIVYWLCLRWKGEPVWERAGYDKRLAERLEKQRKLEIANGSFIPKGGTGRLTVRTWFGRFLDARTNRAAQYERDLIEKHVLGKTREWFASMPVQDVDTRELLRLVEEIKREKLLGSKSLANAYSLVRQAFKRAAIEKLIASDPTELPKGTIKWKSPRSSRRRPYTRAEAHALMTDERVPPEARVWMAISFYTGMRLGEVAARKWSDWHKDTVLLGALSVHSQYDDKPLKTDDGEDVHPRTVPVHPELGRILQDWWNEGFEFVYLRKPTANDRIVPHRKLGTHSKSSGYKLFMRALAATGIASKTLHATRNTFLSVARSNGARKDVIEAVTHNSAGDVVDGYTEWEWRPLCEAVAFVDFALTPEETAAFYQLRSQDSNSEPDTGVDRNAPEPTGIVDTLRDLKTRGKGSGSVGFDATQRRLLKLAEFDPEAARPGLAVCAALATARAGNEDATVAILMAEANAAMGARK